MAEMTNKDRAERARRALLEYVRTEEERREQVQTSEKFTVQEAGQDLICDTLHLVRQVCGPEEVEDILRRALDGHEEEVREEEAANS